MMHMTDSRSWLQSIIDKMVCRKLPLCGLYLVEHDKCTQPSANNNEMEGQIFSMDM